MKLSSDQLFREVSAALKAHKHLLLAIAAGIFVIQGRSSAATSATNVAEPGFFVSTETATFFFIGIIIFFFYIKGMAGVLSNAARTYSSDTEDSQDTYTNGLIGMVLAVIASAIVIWSYGLGPYWLYLGPILSLLSPIGIIHFMNLDIQRYRETPSSRRF